MASVGQVIAYSVATEPYRSCYILVESDPRAVPLDLSALCFRTPVIVGAYGKVDDFHAACRHMQDQLTPLGGGGSGAGVPLDLSLRQLIQIVNACPGFTPCAERVSTLEFPQNQHWYMTELFGTRFEVDQSADSYAFKPVKCFAVIQASRDPTLYSFLPVRFDGSTRKVTPANNWDVVGLLNSSKELVAWPLLLFFAQQRGLPVNWPQAAVRCSVSELHALLTDMAAKGFCEYERVDSSGWNEVEDNEPAGDEFEGDEVSRREIPIPASDNQPEDPSDSSFPRYFSSGAPTGVPDRSSYPWDDLIEEAEKYRHSRDGAPEDYGKAKRLYDKAKDAGCIYVDHEIAQMLIFGGRGLRADEESARRLIEHSIKSGNYFARLTLATLLISEGESRAVNTQIQRFGMERWAGRNPILESKYSVVAMSYTLLSECCRHRFEPTPELRDLFRAVRIELEQFATDLRDYSLEKEGLTEREETSILQMYSSQMDFLGSVD